MRRQARHHQRIVLNGNRKANTDIEWRIAFHPHAPAGFLEIPVGIDILDAVPVSTETQQRLAVAQSAYGVRSAATVPFSRVPAAIWVVLRAAAISPLTSVESNGCPIASAI
jgi:hypothetical protein